MPALSQHATLARQWELLQRLPGKAPGKTVLELNQELRNAGFKVGKRTVQRDLDSLSLIFPLQRNDKGIPHGWHWQSGRPVELPAIGVPEAQTLLLVRDLLKPLVPLTLWDSLEDRFTTATRKLESLGKSNALARWPEKVRAVPAAFPLLPPVIHADVLLAVQQALLNERQCHVRYQGFGSEHASEQTLHPLALLQRGAVTYLVASAFNYGEPRLYAVHRIQQAQVLDEPLRKPAQFNVDAYIANGGPQFGSGDAIVLKAKVSTALGMILTETPLSQDMRLDRTSEDWWTVTATVQDTWQLHWWLMGQGSDIAVLEPKVLRKHIMNDIKASLENYRNRSLNR